MRRPVQPTPAAAVRYSGSRWGVATVREGLKSSRAALRPSSRGESLRPGQSEKQGETTTTRYEGRSDLAFFVPFARSETHRRLDSQQEASIVNCPKCQTTMKERERLTKTVDL